MGIKAPRRCAVRQFAPPAAPRSLPPIPSGRRLPPLLRSCLPGRPGLSPPMPWILIFKGVLRAPAQDSSVRADEMFFGFGWAVLGGFLADADPVLGRGQQEAAEHRPAEAEEHFVGMPLDGRKTLAGAGSTPLKMSIQAIGRLRPARQARAKKGRKPTSQRGWAGESTGGILI